MITEEQAADLEGRLRELYAQGQTKFGPDRVTELVAIGRAPEAPDEASDPRSLLELMWWRDVLNLVADEAAPPVLEWYGRVSDAVTEQGVQGPEQLPPDVRAPLEAEAHLTLRVREAIALFGFEL